MADGVLLDAAIAGVVVLSNVTFGIIVNSMKDEIKGLRGEFTNFAGDCRERHEDVAKKEDVNRDFDKQQDQIDCIFKKVNDLATYPR